MCAFGKTPKDNRGKRLKQTVDVISEGPDFFLRSSHYRVDLLSHVSKTTDKRGQYEWRAEKNLDGYTTIVAKIEESREHCNYMKSIFYRVITVIEYRYTFKSRVTSQILTKFSLAIPSY